MPKTHSDIWTELKKHLSLAEQAEAKADRDLLKKVYEVMNNMIKAEALGGSNRIILYRYHFVNLIKLFPEAYTRYCQVKEFKRLKP